jgi:hypothetical protein
MRFAAIYVLNDCGRLRGEKKLPRATGGLSKQREEVRREGRTAG